ncbi:hypothetical protein U9M48_004251 [Paspalum notatum var. saurae]
MHDYKTCRHCGFMAQLYATRCPSCNNGTSYDDPEDWDYRQLDNPRHLLHGIVHDNGFGHLVRINGREGGSSLLMGFQLMDFWDRLCRYLRVRKVSLMDVSKKYGIDYRILHAVTTGYSWYGQWGFKLNKGSFGITSEEYFKAIENLSSTPLSHFFPHSRSPRNQLQDTIAFYQSLSKRPLTTVRELFLYVRGFPPARATLGNVTIDGMTVAVRCNSESKTLEYRLTDETILMPNVPIPTQDNLRCDIKFLHDALLYPHTMHPYKPEKCYEQAMRSAMVLLDCKQFTKHYDLEQEFLPQNPSMLHVWCQVELLDQDADPPCIPTELLTLPQTATVADLKVEATRTFRGIYLMLQSFVATQLLDCGTASESTQLKLLYGANGMVCIQGRCAGGERRVGIYRMERGIDKWTVHCSCGAKDDDGERMLSCDSCHVWQHTRCAGISDFDQVPKRYVCKSCKLLHKHKSSGPRPVYNSGPNKRCKIDTGAFSRGGFLRPHIS